MCGGYEGPGRHIGERIDWAAVVLSALFFCMQWHNLQLTLKRKEGVAVKIFFTNFNFGASFFLICLLLPMFNVSQFIDPQSINFKSLPPVKHLCDLHLNILLVFSGGCLHMNCSPEITLTDADVSLIPFW